MRLLYPLLLFFTLQTVFLHAQSIRSEKVAGKLLEKMEAELGAFHSVNIVMADRVDLTALDAQLSAQRATASQRSGTVITALKNKAHETQGDLLVSLKNSPGVMAGTVKPYWIANVVFAQVKKETIAELSQRPDVQWIGLNGKLEVQKVEETPPPAPALVPNGKEPGLSVIKAPALWAMGYTGYGRTAFTNDTGIDPDHPAIASRYRGLYVPAEQTWFELDPETLEPSDNHAPYDCGFHGTHVTGTILGLDRMTNDTIGVAFNAQWIGAPILCGIGTEDNVAAFQWSLDPDGDPSTTDDMPDIINNSWYDPSLDTIDCFSVYVPVEEAMEAAGIAVVFSAGNAGPEPMTITQPHNINLHEVSSFTVGALNGNNASLPIANFSSRGPSQCGGDSSILIKPEVSAPGVSVRSCVPGGYTFLNGTSMAAPHVSGAILLLKEAFPNATGKELKLALYHTCMDLGPPGEDNTYGMGVIDVLAAYHYLVDQGHVPVSPYVANDVMVVDVQFPLFSCEQEISPVIVVENAGTDTLHSFDVMYGAGPFANTWAWAGVLAPKERTTLTLPTLLGDPGDYIFKLNLVNPNGTEDERPLNNRIQKAIKVTDRERFMARVEGQSNAVCENTSALLRGEYTGPGSVEVKWYDALNGGNEIGQGPAFATPPLEQPTTYFAGATYTVPLGLKDRSSGETGLEDVQELGLTFDVHAPVTLKSLKIFVGASGGRAFAIQNAEGETVYQKVVAIGTSTVGEITVNLDWELQPGSYLIKKVLGKPFYHNSSGASYPYSVEGIIDITGNNDSLGNQNAWYYFYDWQIEYDEPCGRTAVPVGIVAGGNAPAVAFTVSTDSVDLLNNEPVQFTNGSGSDVLAWIWNFGDGTTNAEENPAHTYTGPGTYTVSLSASNQEGCTGFALGTLLVTESSISSTPPNLPLRDHVTVFPNPVRDAISVHFQLSAAKPVTLYLSDLTGRVLRSAVYPSVQSEVLQLDASALAAGIYFLLVEMGEGKSVWKVVKIEG